MSFRQPGRGPLHTHTPLAQVPLVWPWTIADTIYGICCPAGKKYRGYHASALTKDYMVVMEAFGGKKMTRLASETLGLPHEDTVRKHRRAKEKELGVFAEDAYTNAENIAAEHVPIMQRLGWTCMLAELSIDETGLLQQVGFVGGGGKPVQQADPVPDSIVPPPPKLDATEPEVQELDCGQAAFDHPAPAATSARQAT